MHYATIKKHDIANGPGVRVSLFVSGCTHRCKGCFNREAWDFAYGQPFDESAANEVLDALAPDYIRGLSLLGGEPFEPQNQAALLPLIRRVKAQYPGKSIWCYSGYDFEKDMLAGRLGDFAVTRELLSYIDYLVDGEFVEALKSPSLRFKGSSNQRIIDVQRSLAEDRVVRWEEDTTDGPERERN